LGKNNCAKIGDFGAAKKLEEDDEFGNQEK